jgi:hypothetical protein
MQLWGTSRATRDIDILIPKDLVNAERILAGLEEVGYGYAREWLASEIIAKPVTIIGDDPRVDIMTVAWSVPYVRAAADATVFEVEGVLIPTASIDHLMDSKRTGRLQDAADVEVLREIKRLMRER